MADRDYGHEIDELKTTVGELLHIVKGGPEVRKDPTPAVREKAIMQGGWAHHSDSRIDEVSYEYAASCPKDGGRITTIGTYAAGGHQSTWVSEYKSVDGLFDTIENGDAEKVLKCIGSSSRLTLILTLLKKPMNVNQLIEEGSYTSTGQVYHHLQPLINADIITEDAHNRGVYIIQPHRVQGIITILAGINDLLNHEYSQGKFEE